MNILFRCFILACALLCAAVLPAEAGNAWFEVVLTNQTPFEVQNVSISGKSWGDAVTDVRIAPKNSCSIGMEGHLQDVDRISLDMGVARFVFDDISQLWGNAPLRLQVVLEKDGFPALLPQEEGSRAATGEDSQRELSLQAGPIWSDGHAQERCPEVLKEWLEANPGKSAVWTGHWVTTVPGEMSVCGMREQAASQSKALQPRIEGRFQPLVGENETGGVDFSELLAVQTMAQVKSLAEKTGQADSPERSDHTLALKVRFGGSTWMAFVRPDDSSHDAFALYDAAKVRPGNISMRAYAGDKALAGVMEAVQSMDWRPWFLQVQEGEDMDLSLALGMFKQALSPQKAWARVHDTYGAMAASPTAVSCLFLSDRHYKDAARADLPDMPAIIFRAGNSRVMVLNYYLNGSMYVAMSR